MNKHRHDGLPRERSAANSLRTFHSVTAIGGLLLLMLTLCSGCGTCWNHPSGREPERYGIYRGVRFDVGLIAKSESDPNLKGASACFAAWDLPFCFIADTICLPFDLFQGGPSSPRAKDSE